MSEILFKLHKIGGRTLAIPVSATAYQISRVPSARATPGLQTIPSGRAARRPVCFPPGTLTTNREETHEHPVLKPETYRTKPAITWPGGKSKLLKYILPLIPEHTCYVEPFAGGLAVLLAKPRSSIEVLNDLNGDLVTFYRCVRFHTDTLLTELEFVLNSRQEFRDFADQPGLTDIQRAARWFFRKSNCFRGSNLGTFGVSPTSAGGASGSRSARMESIRQLNFRLDRVTVENLDWLKCVDLYDRPTTFYFIDPPYTDCDAGMYSAWTITDIQILKQRLDRLRGKWMVTLNDSVPIRQIFADCEIKSIERPKGIGGKGKPYRELLITPREAK